MTRREWLEVARRANSVDSTVYMCVSAKRIAGDAGETSVRALTGEMHMSLAWRCDCLGADRSCYIGPCEPRILFACLMAAMTDAERKELVR